MRTFLLGVLSFFISQIVLSQKKSFFDKLDMMLNIHIGDRSIEKDSWPGLFKSNNSNYQIDTFRYSEIGRGTCMLYIPVYWSMGIRIGKNLFNNSDKQIIRDRLEWRTGLLTGSKLQTSTYLTDRDPYSSAIQPPYRYREVTLSYRRFWLDYSNQVVYKIRSLLMKNKLKYYVGAGVGLTLETNSRVSETYVQNLVTQSGNSYIVTQEINASRNEKGKTVTNTYLNLVTGSEIKCTDELYLLLEANYQGYIRLFSMRKRLYKEGGYLSLIFRYSF